ncbi:MAG: hypothetical protein LBC95_00160 [Candidatus Nomurabacteria bacterium]|jgi:hypothetical protein|nr:hypothetical protein [Candidatus Nomurabacteria bacterium]
MTAISDVIKDTPLRYNSPNEALNAQFAEIQHRIASIATGFDHYATELTPDELDRRRQIRERLLETIAVIPMDIDIPRPIEPNKNVLATDRQEKLASDINKRRESEHYAKVRDLVSDAIVSTTKKYLGTGLVYANFAQLWERAAAFRADIKNIIEDGSVISLEDARAICEREYYEFYNKMV